jgi:MinD-like ATPase involved in chromosome partitioning or flagellar assembly
VSDSFTTPTPVCAAFLRSNGSGEVLINKDTATIAAPDLVSARSEAMRIVGQAAAKFGGPLMVTCSDPEGLFRLIVSPNGSVTEAPRESALPRTASATQTGYRSSPADLPPAPPRRSSPQPSFDQRSTASTPTIGIDQDDQSAQRPEVTLPPLPRLGAPSEAPIATNINDSPPVMITSPVGLGAILPEARPNAPTPATPIPPTGVGAPLTPVGGNTRQTVGNAASTDRASGASSASFITPIRVEPPNAQPYAGPTPRRAFIDVTEATSNYAEQGWRGALARHGVPVPPSDAELIERNRRQTVAHQWAGPRTVAVVNGKGGAGKTPTTICLSAVFARYGGAGVLAWDNNQTRGTLGWRTEQGPHQSTLLDLLPEVPHLLSSDAHGADLAPFVHHQSRDLYDVLRSKAIVLADEQRITPEDVDAIWRVASKYYRLIVMDSGNDESDPMWRRMIDHTDQLVTVTTTRADHAEAGALLLEALYKRNQRSAQLARNSVTIITQADPKASDESIRRVREGYATLCRDVVFIPYDPVMVEGALFYDALKPVTQRAWLAAAATVAQGF